MNIVVVVVKLKSRFVYFCHFCRVLLRVAWVGAPNAFFRGMGGTILYNFCFHLRFEDRFQATRERQRELVWRLVRRAAAGLGRDRPVPVSSLVQIFCTLYKVAASLHGE